MGYLNCNQAHLRIHGKGIQPTNMPVFLLCFFLWGISHGYEHVDWNQQAQETLKLAIAQELNQNVAKNVILFIGDGMGVSTVTAARIYKGQLAGRPGEEEILSFEKFPYAALSKTYNVDATVPDSAGTATAFVCGVKAQRRTLGVNQNVSSGDCPGQAGNEVSSMLDWSLDEGKSVGIATTTRITHATPAAAYAHAAHRDWESDVRTVPPCEDIASQLIKHNNISVILGGGRSRFMTNITEDPEYVNQTGEREDGRDLIQEWIDDKEQRGLNHEYVWNLESFNQVQSDQTDYLFGLFEPDHMKYEEYREDDLAGEPSLTEMVRKSIEILQKNDQGYFLYVEGGRIDHAHHANQAKLSFRDTIALADAVQMAVNMTDDDDTLIIVTADHSHVVTIAGYSSRGNDILGLADIDMSSDGRPYQTISYANGPNPGFRNYTGDEEFHDPEFKQSSLVPRSSETHAGEDVAIYSTGPMAHLLSGVFEQNYIAHAMAYAACVGINKEHCSNIVPPTTPVPTEPPGGGATGLNIKSSWTFLLICTALLNYFYTWF